MSKEAPALDDRSRLHRKANEALDENLLSDEPVKVIVEGNQGQALIATDRRIFVFKKGFMAGAAFGSEMTSFAFDKVIGIQLHYGMASGAVLVQVAGLPGTSTSWWKNKDADPWKAPNAIPTNKPRKHVSAQVAEIRKLLAG